MFMSGSFKRYTDIKSQADQADKMESGGRAGNDAIELDEFMHEVELIKEDVRTMEKLSRSLNEANEESKTIQAATTMKELRSFMDSNIDHVLMLAKSIKKRIEGLERLSRNNPDRRISGAGSSIDRTRISVVMGLGKKLRDMMDEFQGLRVRTAAVYKETIEYKYFSITGEKQFIETIENLVTTGGIEDCLSEAIQEHGMDRVHDFISEIQERHQGYKNLQRNLVELHQTFLDMTVLVDTQSQKMANGGGGGGGGGENQVAGGNSFLKPTGVAQLQDQPDYDREARRRATVGLVLAVCLVCMIIIPLFVAESSRDPE